MVNLGKNLHSKNINGNKLAVDGFSVNLTSFIIKGIDKIRFCRVNCNK